MNASNALSPATTRGCMTVPASLPREWFINLGLSGGWRLAPGGLPAGRWGSNRDFILLEAFYAKDASREGILSSEPVRNIRAIAVVPPPQHPVGERLAMRPCTDRKSSSILESQQRRRPAALLSCDRPPSSTWGPPRTAFFFSKTRFSFDSHLSQGYILRNLNPRNGGLLNAGI